METFIKLLSNWEEHPTSSILQVSDALAKMLIDGGIATAYDPVAAKAAADAEAKATQASIEQIQTIVKAEIAEAVKGTATVPGAITKPRAEDDPRHGFSSGGEFLKSVADHFTGKGTDERLMYKAPSGLGETVDSDGGFLVPDEFRATLLEKTYNSAAVSSRAFNIPINHAVNIPYVAESSRTDGYRAGGVLGYWVDEAPASGITASAPTFGKVRLELHKVAALVYGTDDILADSVVSLDAFLSRVVPNELAFQLDDKMINGKGAGVPLGILNAACLVSVDKETGQEAATIQFENIVKMWSRLYNGSRSSAVWFVNQDVLPQLYSLTLGLGLAGVAAFMPPGGLSGAQYATIFGRPVVEIEQCATLGTVGDVILADMGQYLYASKAGNAINAASSIHVRFIYNETTWRFTMRADGQPWWSKALTPYKGSSTVSPFVALATRA